MSTLYPISGSCQCQQVRYQLLAAPEKVMACHCKGCQKLSTSPFSMTAFVKSEHLCFQGEMKQWDRKADSGNTNSAFFCSGCGNRIYHLNPDQPDIIKLKPGTLKDTSILNPTIHLWVSQKQDWYQIPEGSTVFQKQP